MLKFNNKLETKRASVSSRLFIVAVALFVLFNVFSAELAFAQSVDYPQESGLANNAGLDNLAGKVNLPTTDIRIFIVRLINIALSLIGIILLGLIIYGGWLWMTSEGDPGKIEKAKAIFKNAAIGLVIILSSFGIVNFILKALWGGEGGGGAGQPPDPYIGVSAIGDGIIESHYPERDQRNVPINTMIFITFKEEINPNTICKADDGTDKTKCDGDNLRSANIRIYPTNVNFDDGAQRADDQVAVISTDNKTFVFMPKQFLGTLGSPAWFAVKIMHGAGAPKSDFTNGLFKVSGDPVVLGFKDNDYKWKFETNGKLDLEPPQVSAIFPWPDNWRDEKTTNAAAVAATGEIKVIKQPNIYKKATAGAPLKQNVNFEDAVIFGEYACNWSGTITMSINSGKSVVSGTSKEGLITGDDISDQTANVGCGLSLKAKDQSFTEGNSWTIAVTPEIKADTLTVGDRVYVFGNGTGEITIGSREEKTAENIITSINIANTLVFTKAGNQGNIITLTAKIAGAAGNNIALDASNPSALQITKMSGGKDKEDNIKIVGRPDEPRNAVIQINFNEAVNPLYVNGNARDLTYYLKVQYRGKKIIDEKCADDKECFSNSCSGNKCTEGGGVGDDCTTNGSLDNSRCFSYECNTSKKCVGDSLSGKFTVSNNYRTAEFISNNQCGENSCGDKIYCLPALSNIRVFLHAASLRACTNNADCTPTAGILSDYNECGAGGRVKFCQKTIGSKTINYPQSDLTVVNPMNKGIVDAANNSLDGDKDGNAEGPETQSGHVAFYENGLYGLCSSGANKGRICTADNVEEICGTGNDCQDAESKNVQSIIQWQEERGDNFAWSFFTSAKIDLNSPIIMEVKGKKAADKSDDLDLVKVEAGAGKQVLGANQTEPVRILFDKLMMSSSLKPGRNYPQDYYYNPVGTAPKVQKEYLIMMNYSGRPLGYWCAKEDKDTQAPLDGFADQTQAIISHTQFDDSSSYGSLFGSGVKDIYQNCYNPAADKGQGGSECNSGMTAGSSCCKGVINTSAEKCYKF